jgi:hypothetical protein
MPALAVVVRPDWYQEAQPVSYWSPCGLHPPLLNIVHEQQRGWVLRHRLQLVEGGSDLLRGKEWQRHHPPDVPEDGALFVVGGDQP